jgi:simple sugar transport system substrate-binding protein
MSTGKLFTSAAESSIKLLLVSSAATNELPAKVASGELRIAVVRQLNTGDYYEQWISGVQSEAERLKIKLDIYNANGDNARQALFLQQAVASKPDAIVVGWGIADTVTPGLEAARDACIPIVAFYVLHAEPSKDVAIIEQDDRLMMKGILEQLASDLGGSELSADVIYVYAPGYQSLDSRDAVWQAFIKENPGIRTVATFGVVNPDTVAQVTNQTRSALAANRDVKAVIAPWDGFARGATAGIEELSLQKEIKVYGIDISTGDISVMTKPDSPWVITATTDAANVGSVVLRAAALKALGQLEGEFLSVAPVLVTQEGLRAKQIHNMDQLKESFPDLRTPKLISAPWMDNLK